MKKIFISFTLMLFIMAGIAGCGGSGGDGSYFVSSDGTTTVGSGSGSVTLAWDAPVTSDGTPLTNIVGYKVHYGTSPGSYGSTIDNRDNTTCIISGLNSGTYYFSVTCYDGNDNESTFSNEVSKTIQ